MRRSPHAEYLRRQKFLRRRTTRVEQASWVSKKRGHQLQTIQTAAEIMFVCLGNVRHRRFVTNLLLGALQIFFVIIILIISTSL